MTVPLVLFVTRSMPLISGSSKPGSISFPVKSIVTAGPSSFAVERSLFAVGATLIKVRFTPAEVVVSVPSDT